MQRYLINESIIHTPYIYLNSEDSYHISKVLRMKTDDEVICTVINKKIDYLCKIVNIDKDSVTLEIVKEMINDNELKVNVSIAHGLVNRNKIEETVEKLSLLGSHNYYFFPMIRSNVKSIDEKLDKKLVRLNKIAKEASEVSHRNQILNSIYLNNLDEFIKETADFDYKLVAYEDEDFDSASFKDTLKSLKENDKIVVLIGPEGGIDTKEIKKLVDNGFKLVSLGKRILRTEVAPTYVLASISYELELKE